MSISTRSNRLLRNFIYHTVHNNACRTQQRLLHLHLCYPKRCAVERHSLPRIPHRTFSSSNVIRASIASHPPGQPTELLYYPTPASLPPPEDPDEPEVELVPPQEAKIEMTERAAEQLRTVAHRQNNPNAALRISVESGGCHGYQYKIELATNRNPDDYHFSHSSIKPSNIVVDAVSMSLLKGSIVDFATELIGSSFRILDNPQAKGSGCGCGVSWELKV